MSDSNGTVQIPQMVSNIATEVGIPKEQFPQFNVFITNVMSMRSELINKFIDPRRSIEDECGYPSVVTIDMYEDMYARNPLAARVVEAFSKETWQTIPSIYEQEEPELTEWEKAWNEFLSGFSNKNGKGYFDPEGGSLFWEYTEEADIKCGIGSYGVMFFGFTDGKPLNQPVIPKEGLKVAYIRVLTESQAEIKSKDTDPGSPRFGYPTMYSFKVPNPQDNTSIGIGVGGFIEEDVHWTRVVHISEGDVTHTPRMQQVFNNLLGANKLYSGSPEMYWRGAFPGLAIESDPRLGGDIDFDETVMKSMMERYMNGLQRYLSLNGFTAKSLAPQVVDPTNHINAQIGGICIRIPMPIRVFMGSERGELASSQDAISWRQRVRKRQYGVVTHRIVVPILAHLMYLKVLPEPKNPLHIYWPDLDSQTDDQKALVSVKLTQALVMYASQNGSSVLDPYWFLTRVLKFTEIEARTALEAAKKSLEKGTLDSKTLMGTSDGVKSLVEMFKLAKEGGISEEQMKQTLVMFYGMTEEEAMTLISDWVPGITVPIASAVGGL